MLPEIAPSMLHTTINSLSCLMFHLKCRVQHFFHLQYPNRVMWRLSTSSREPKATPGSGSLLDPYQLPRGPGAQTGGTSSRGHNEITAFQMFLSLNKHIHMNSKE